MPHLPAKVLRSKKASTPNLSIPKTKKRNKLSQTTKANLIIQNLAIPHFREPQTRKSMNKTQRNLRKSQKAKEAAVELLKSPRKCQGRKRRQQFNLLLSTHAKVRIQWFRSSCHRNLRLLGPSTHACKVWMKSCATWTLWQTWLTRSSLKLIRALHGQLRRRQKV